MEVTVELHPGGGRGLPLREAAQEYAQVHGAPKTYQGIAAVVNETGYILLDVAGVDGKQVFLETCKAVWELGAAREWTEAQWAQNKRDLRKLASARAAVELKVEEVAVGKESEVLYNAAGQIAMTRDRKVVGKKLRVTGW